MGEGHLKVKVRIQRVSICGQPIKQLGPGFKEYYTDRPTERYELLTIENVSIRHVLIEL